MRKIYLNDQWTFYKSWNDACLKTSLDVEGEKVRLPHTNVCLSYNYCNAEDYQGVCGYVRMLTLPQDFKGRRLLLTFEGVAHFAQVFINGRKAGAHMGGYTAFTLDISSYVNYGRENRIAVRVDSREALNIPPFGTSADDMTFGGIYRDVYLQVKGDRGIDDVFLRTKNIYDSNGDLTGQALLSCRIRLFALENADGDPVAFWKDWLVQVYVFDQEDNCIGRMTQAVERGRLCPRLRLSDIRYWDTGHPNLYTAEILLRRPDGMIGDARTLRFGFRDVEFKQGGFYLNRQKVRLVGLGRHQSFPYVGYAMPASMQKLDADILKNELGVNAVRTSHCPQSRHFVDRCDELGLLVFTEIPGWGTAGDKRRQNMICRNVREMITQYRNHPSVILWGIGADAWEENDSLRRRTNALALKLDPSRTTADLAGAKVVTACDGYPYPSKNFDPQWSRINHALRHASTLDAIFADWGVGAGFCGDMFDYNSRSDFGSGDGICYHGVLDMFRNPKPAAAVYKSQHFGALVCQVAPSMAVGDGPGGQRGRLWIFTNADKVHVYKNDVYMNTFEPDRENFPHLPHPPVCIDDWIGDQLVTREGMNRGRAAFVKEVLLAAADCRPDTFTGKYSLKIARKMGLHHLTREDFFRLYEKYIIGRDPQGTVYRFEACRRLPDGGEEKLSVLRGPVRSVRLEVTCDHTQLVEGHSYDVARISIQAVGDGGEVLPYFNEPVRIIAWGDIRVIGPHTISLKGGMGAVYIKTTGHRTFGGTGRVLLCTEQTQSAAVDFAIRWEKRR
ncbi:MAG: glycoside hydrolase family 2 protein [Catenibacillus sp.]